MAEALMNAAGAGRFRAWSAGSQPSGVVNPDALLALRGMGVPVPDARSKFTQLAQSFVKKPPHPLLELHERPLWGLLTKAVVLSRMLC